VQETGFLGTAATRAADITLLLLPEKLRLKRYKFWMRGVLFIWWIVLLLGMATYARWYAGIR
jgi:hypothetical protein